MPRMNILNTVEREAFDSPPVFNSVQRKQNFDFPSQLRRVAGSLRVPTFLRRGSSCQKGSASYAAAGNSLAPRFSIGTKSRTS
jgi:hypothetical protein